MAITNVQASLILTGHHDPCTAAAVTAALAIEPTRSHEFGEPHPSPRLAAQGKVTTNSFWEYAEARTISNAEDPHGVESLVRLAERFEPHVDTLATLRTNYEITVDLHGFSDSGQGGLWIGPETMRRLGRLGASFRQTFYLDEPLTLDDLGAEDDASY